MAKSIIQQAICGQRKALETLYEANKQKAFDLAYCLLLDEKKAENAVIWAMKASFDHKNLSTIETEEDYTQSVTNKIFSYCKKSAVTENQKAFQLPKNKNFYVSLNQISTDNQEEFIWEMLRSLPSLQQFIFVLHTVGHYNQDDLSKAMKFDRKTIDIALTDEKKTIENIIQLSKQNDLTYNKIIDKIIENHIQISARVNHAIMKKIDEIASPIEKKKKQKTKRICIILAIIFVIIGIFFVTLSFQSNKNVKTSEVTETTLDEDKTYYADIQIQDYGTITVKLDQESAPITVENFVNLAKSGFYDGLTFHRIIEDFMMQGGDPNGNGTGGSDETIVGEFSDNGYDNNLSHTRGAISMARSSDYDSASSQFFIVHQDSTYLDGQYAVFGYVSDGMDVVDKVCEEAEPTDSNGTISSSEQPIITSVTIREE